VIQERQAVIRAGEFPRERPRRMKDSFWPGFMLIERLDLLNKNLKSLKLTKR
jgi:hypothetical protein